jgi:hypothetical protein
MKKRAAEFALHGGARSYMEALTAPLSVVDDFFASEAYRTQVDYRTAADQVQVGVAERLNEVIRGLGKLGGLIVKTAGRR